MRPRRTWDTAWFGHPHGWATLIKLKEPMLKKKYAQWMYEWETRLTMRDENRVVRPLEWGFEWIELFLREHGFEEAIPGPETLRDPALAEAAMVRINQLLI